jgi:nicotinate-nucleotide pyrophosphorylase (carboxylating)
MSMPKEILANKLRKFVEEDIGSGDITTFSTVPAGLTVEGDVVAKEKGLIAGLDEAGVLAEAFGLQATALVKEGSDIAAKTSVLHIWGDAATMLAVERTLLNLLSRMSGVATHTSRLVERIHGAGYRTVVAATRKTVPGMAFFDKKAVMVGGGDSHRSGLDDMVLIKDNHVAIVGSVKQAVEKARRRASFSKKIEVEVSNANDALMAAEAHADIVMLDNFTPEQVREAIDLLKRKKRRTRVLVEASGGINEHNVLEYAGAGVDIISMGEITQNAKPLDMSLEVTKVKKLGS